MAKTPMMRQYEEAKAACPQAILLFRMGDFYELFYHDAEIAAQKLGLTLTSRDKSEDPVPMAGFPHHQLDSYLGKLIAAGFRVAICDQVEDPKTAKGIVKREVTRIVSPGTLTEDALLDPRRSNFLAMVWADSQQDQDPVGVAWIDLSTGLFYATQLGSSEAVDLVSRIAPRELLVVDESTWHQQLDGNGWLLTQRPAWTTAADRSVTALCRQFGVKTLDGFGFDESDLPAIRAAGGILEYLKETQKSSLEHIDRLIPYRTGQSLEIDRATWRSLEIDRTYRDQSRDGSLISVVDRCVTAMGSRKLSEWLAQPLVCIDAISARHDAVAALVSDSRRRESIRQSLTQIFDLERLLARVITRRATPRDLAFVGRTLVQLPAVAEQLANVDSPLLRQLYDDLDPLAELREELLAALAQPAPLSNRDGDIFNSGYNTQLDELRELAAGGKKWIAQYQQRIQTETNIPSIKVGFNKVFGYYIEVTHLHRDKLPAEFIRKQTLKNAERFITPELKEYEEKVLSADESARELEYELFTQLRQRVHDVAGPLKRNAQILATLDVLAGLAELAERQNYCRPKLTTDQRLEIVDGRHPVLDVLKPMGTFVPNDTRLSEDDGWIHLITGPNMSGKSTYIRQVALIVLLGQAGSFVPAAECTMGIADRIFARVGASDELARGQSTFMVEMTESARILNTATTRSLVILDEIGRGTSTYDGVSLAWAMVEYLHDQVGCRTLFATHYHELTELEKSLEGVRNQNVSVKQWHDEVVFLHKIIAGATNKSWGIHVARLAGIPPWVQQRAEQILSKLETDPQNNQHAEQLKSATERSTGKVQLTLFEFANHPLLEKIQRFDIQHETPMRALQTIESWQKELHRKS